MITVERVEDVEGRVIREEAPYVKVLSRPRYENGQWTAVAQVEGMLAVISLEVTPQPEEPKR